MKFPVTRPKSLINVRNAKRNGVAGVVLGVESAPDGLASGLLAGVNPIAGLYAYLFGVAGALFTGTAMMAVQGTGAMAIIVADVDLGLLIVVGVGTVRPERILSFARTGVFPLTVMSITFALTMLIPLQYAVLVGVGISVILYVGRQSTRLVTRQLVFHDSGDVEEVDPVREVPAGQVVVLQPYGAVFFATAPTLLDQLPAVTADATNSWVVLRIRGADEACASLIDVLRRYAGELDEVGSRQSSRDRHRQRPGDQTTSCHGHHRHHRRRRHLSRHSLHRAVHTPCEIRRPGVDPQPADGDLRRSRRPRRSRRTRRHVELMIHHSNKQEDR